MAEIDIKQTILIFSTTKIEAPVSTESPTKTDDKKDSSNDNITIKKWTDAERAAARAARFATETLKKRTKKFYQSSSSVISKVVTISSC